MSKKHIIIALGAGLLTFAAAFVGTWLLGRSSPTLSVETKTATAKQTAATTQPEAEGFKSAMADSQTGDEAETVRGLSQKQLKSLVYEVREKINDYESKVRELDLREARLQMTQETLKKDIDELSRMKVELASMVANLKEQKNQLLETRAEIARSEKVNLALIAATYDKMDPASAGKILINMCAKQMESGKIEGGNIDDAVKILFYMTERTKAKLLGEMVTTEPKLAATLCQRLKTIVEQ